MNLNVTHVLHADTCPIEPQTLEDQLRAFWELEALGIPDMEKTLYDTFKKAAKTRVVPLIVQTIPRLELLSAFLLSKLMVSVHNSLQHQITHLNMRSILIHK